MKTRKNIFIQPFNKLLKWLPVLGLLILATGLNSCEDFLTQNNPNQTSSDKFWSNLDDTNKGLTSTYAVLRNAYLVNTNIEAWRSDMGWPGYGRPTPTLGLENYNTWYAHGYTDSNDDISKKWEACYLGIFRAGQVIEALDRIKGTVNETELNLQMGQARFLRGLFYFYLYNAFNEGKVILHKTVPRTMEEFHKDVATAPEVFNFFMSDLKIAYQLLPAKFSTIDANLGRPSAGAAATILGTSYMYKNDIDSAMIYFNDVIGGKAESNRYGYALEDELDKMFTTKGEYNSESILEVSYSIDYNQDLGIWSNESFANRLHSMSTNTVGFLVPAWLAYKYKKEPMDVNDTRNWYTDSLGVQKLRNVPLRASSMITLIEDEQTKAYLVNSTTESMNTGGSSFQCGGPACEWGFSKYKKFTNHDLYEKERPLESGSGKNITLNRLSDVYLLYAECLAQKGNIPDALYFINKIRARWGLVLLGSDDGNFPGRTFDAKSYTSDEVLKHLQYTERPLELSVEGNQIRWQDLRRWNIIKSNFEKLASENYYTIYYSYYNSKLKTFYNSGKSAIISQTDFNDMTIAAATNESIANRLKEPYFIDYEYDVSANNFKAEIHTYYPIPMSEKMSNLKYKQ